LKRKEVRYYVTKSGKKPFIEWFKKLEKRTQLLVTDYVDRVAENTSFKNIKSLKDGIFEIRIFNNSGTRVYFAKDGDAIILLLIGGNKSSQKSDILKAKKYWREYAQK
jgi:putative addiction module killer protein